MGVLASTSARRRGSHDRSRPICKTDAGTPLLASRVTIAGIAVGAILACSNIVVGFLTHSTSVTPSISCPRSLHLPRSAWRPMILRGSSVNVLTDNG
jgi:hypothetical protein